MTFEDQLKAIVFSHLEEHTSAQHLLQVLEEDEFARNTIAPKEGGVNQSKEPVRVVGYTVDGIRYWVATNRYDLSAEQIAFIYKL